jgi:hypothetical protein
MWLPFDLNTLEALTMTTVESLQALLEKRFGGLLYAGRHASTENAACILELGSKAIGAPWTDNPQMLNTWDMRLINDIAVSPKLRTPWMLRVYAAYQDCRSWPIERQQAVATAIVIGTVRRVIAELPGLTDEVRAQCRAVTTMDEARIAARTSAAAARTLAAAARTVANAEDAVHAARSAADAARSAAHAAHAARSAARSAAWAAGGVSSTNEAVFIAACEVWLEAVQSQLLDNSLCLGS